MRVVAVIPAAGEGRRMGGACEKQFLCLQGIPLLAHTLALFEQSPVVDGVVVVIPAHQRRLLEDEVLRPYHCRKVIAVVDGGRERQESVAHGLEAVPAECEVVVVHDGVRPLVSEELLAAVVEAAQKHGAALAAIAVRDTVKRVEDRNVAATIERDGLWLAQTPQAFHAGLLRRAHAKARREQTTATDDAALVERLGVQVHVVPGSERNIKVTTPDDLVVAEALLAARSTE
ncbi:MAG: 2-C-methyl-D-erythritol 4-phosphate cytidylyltransferase [Syntrophobacteria bacterium]